MLETEKEFYSKVCVASSIKFVVSEPSEEGIDLSDGDKFCCNLATILARDREVVAVNLKILPKKCKIYIAKNSAWHDKEYEYIEKVKETLTNVSKDAPMSFDQAHQRNDVKELGLDIFDYCYDKFGYRWDKLKEDIANKEGKINKVHIDSFLDFAKTRINIDDMGDMYERAPTISRVCYDYYQIVKKDSTIPKKFLRHIKKVGSYIGSFIDITNCARKEVYKISFSCIDLHVLNPDIAFQDICSWDSIVEKFLPNPKKYDNFKKKCEKDREIGEGLQRVYGVGAKLDCENTNRIYLHAELNVLSEIMDQDKGKKFIAVSKRCCYLCESYIRFLKSKGYRIIVSESHKKLYHKWKLPNAFKQEFMEDMTFDLDEIIERETRHHTCINAKSDSSDIGRNFSTTVSYMDTSSMKKRKFLL